MVLSLFIMGKKSRLVVGYVLIGTTVCILASELNTHIYLGLGKDMLYFSTTVSPVTEEILMTVRQLLASIKLQGGFFDEQ